MEEVKRRMISRDCDGCSKLKECSKRFQKAIKGDKVYCPDGTAHLVDEDSIRTIVECIPVVS
jgi:hypothetical protein